MKKIIIIIAVFTSSIIFAQESGKIAFGPYIQQMGTKSATICWSTEVSKPTLTDQEGKVKTITGGDGITRKLLEIPGSYRCKTGFFQYIIESNNTINHRIFIPSVK